MDVFDFLILEKFNRELMARDLDRLGLKNLDVLRKEVQAKIEQEILRDKNDRNSIKKN
jgi:hypothetical protein